MKGRGRKVRGIKNKWREGEGRGGVFRINGGVGQGRGGVFRINGWKGKEGEGYKE